MAIKLGMVKKRCPDGELYIFKKGIAVVHGVYFQRKLMIITLSEFNEMTKEVLAVTE